MRSRTLRQADNIKAAFQDLTQAVRAHEFDRGNFPPDEKVAARLAECFANFVSLVRGEIAQQTKLSEQQS